MLKSASSSDKETVGSTDSQTKKCAANTSSLSILYEGNQTKQNLQLLSAKYDAFSRLNEKILTSPIQGIAAIVGCFMATMGSAAVVFTALIMALTVAQKVYKYNELHFISSACFSFYSDIMEDLIKIEDFYNKEDFWRSQNANIIKPVALMNRIKKNNYMVMLHLLKSMMFDLDPQSTVPMQFFFYNTLLERMHFDKTRFDNEWNPTNGLRDGDYYYTSDYCKKLGSAIMYVAYMRRDSKSKVFEKKVYSKTVNQKFLKGSYVNIEDLKPQDGCFNQEDCVNINDILVRALQYCYYVLLHRNIGKGSPDSIVKMNSLGEYFVNADESESTDNDFPTLVKIQFRNHLRRITRELFCVVGEKYDPNSETFIKRGFEFFKQFCNKSYSAPTQSDLVNYVLGTPNQLYREMLREYTIMTGNFLLLTSRYNIDVNQIMIRNLGSELTKITTNTEELQKAIEVVDRIVETESPVEYDSDNPDSRPTTITTMIKGGTFKKKRCGGPNRTRR